MKKANSEDSKIKKAYEKPKVAFERELEALAGICDDKDGIHLCKASVPICEPGYLQS